MRRARRGLFVVIVAPLAVVGLAPWGGVTFIAVKLPLLSAARATAGLVAASR